MGHAREHFLRVSAQHLADTAQANNPLANASAYELMLAQLINHRRRLKDIQSIESKIELKKTLLPEYHAWLTGVLAGNHGTQDEVLMTCMAWHIDCCQWADALPLAEYALHHKLVLPEQFKRTLATMIVEEVADNALKVNTAVPLPVLIDIEIMTRVEDMPDQVRAKLYKAIGFAKRSANEAPSALDWLSRALALDERVGVKKDIERLDREIKAAAKEQPASTS